MNKPLTDHERSKDAYVLSCFYTKELKLNHAFYEREREKTETEREKTETERESLILTCSDLQITGV